MRWPSGLNATERIGPSCPRRTRGSPVPSAFHTRAVWSHDPDIDLRTVDVHVRRLRKALNDGGRRDIIRTVRSAGYSLDAEA